jgi:hypothetical protein
LVAILLGVIFVNMHFARERREEATRQLSERVEIARRSITEAKWDDAIKDLKQIKITTLANELTEEGPTLLSEMDRLLSEAETSVEKIRADRLLDSAEDAIRNGRWADAEGGLRQYIASSQAAKRTRASLLLKALDLIKSAASAVEFLSSLSDPQFKGFAERGDLPSLDLIGFDTLRMKCLDNLRDNISEARTRREAIRKQREESERLAASEGQSPPPNTSSTFGSGLSYSSPRSSSSRRSPGTEVHVRGYTRKDGTYVQPHTRSAPRRR